MPNNIAIIPARAGSKRIPNKNILPIDGKPVIAHTIEIAKKTDFFESIVVSTDSEVIAQISTNNGASVPFVRPASLSEDHSTTRDVITHAIEEMNLDPDDRVCCLYPTSILTQPKTLIDGFERSKQLPDYFVFSICQFPSSPFRAFNVSQSNQSLSPLFPEYSETRTQDLAPTFFDAGQFYWGTARLWASGNPVHKFGSGIEVPWWQAIDLDEPTDVERLGYAYHLFGGN